MKKYYTLLKTADAEKRAIKNSYCLQSDSVIPIIEITRGRKIPKRNDQEKEKIKQDNKITPGIYSFEKNQKEFIRLTAKNKDRKFFIDLTSEESLTCFELDALKSSSNGYQKYVDFFREIKNEFMNAAPILLINPSSEDTFSQYLEDIKNQLLEFAKFNNHIVYRASIFEDEEFINDIYLLKTEINNYINSGNFFSVILDHEYIRPNAGRKHVDRTNKIALKIKEIIPSCHLIFLATSYPKSATDIGDDKFGLFPIEEIQLFKGIKEKLEIDYGDYVSVNPIRNDEQIMANGWRPRIDYITNDDTNPQYYYFREKRKVVGIQEKNGIKKNVLDKYEPYYKIVASSILEYKECEKQINCWGLDQIESTSQGIISSTAPAYWISVRMDVHANKILKILASI